MLFTQELLSPVVTSYCLFVLTNSQTGTSLGFALQFAEYDIYIEEYFLSRSRSVRLLAVVKQVVVGGVARVSFV